MLSREEHRAGWEAARSRVERAEARSGRWARWALQAGVRDAQPDDGWDVLVPVGRDRLAWWVELEDRVREMRSQEAVWAQATRAGSPAA